MSNSVIQPYLMFGGRCEEALAFYTSALGAQVEMLMYFHQSPDPVPAGMLAPGFENKVMHCAFRIGKTSVLASDGCNEGSSFAGFSLALSFETVEETEKAFHALTDGGQVSMPLAKTFWSPSFGMLTDRFGVAWMVMTMDANAGPSA